MEEEKNGLVKGLESIVLNGNKELRNVLRDYGYINIYDLTDEDVSKLFNVGDAMSSKIRDNKLSLKEVIDRKEQEIRNEVDSIMEEISKMKESYNEAKRLHEWEKMKKIRMEREFKAGQLVELDIVFSMLLEIATRLRGVGVAIGRKYSKEAQELLNEAILDMSTNLDKKKTRLLKKLKKSYVK